MSSETTTTLRDAAKALKANGMRCNCDLDRWEPEKSTGHSRVCQIHKVATAGNDLTSRHLTREEPKP